MMLHTISTSNPIRIKPELISSDDAVLFWQNGVILSLQGNRLLSAILAQTQNCYVLSCDINARGLDHLVDSKIIVIDIKRAVTLTEQYTPQINWGD